MIGSRRSGTSARPPQGRLASPGRRPRPWVLLIIAGLVWALVGPGSPAAAAVPSGGITTLTQKRVLDTRKTSALGAHSTLTLALAGEVGNGVPGSATGAFANLTVVHATASGFLTVFPTGQTRPLASSINFDTSQSAYANHILIKIGQAGKISIYNGSAKAVQVLLDVTGYVSGGSALGAGATVPLNPARVLDTGTGNGTPKAPVAAGKRIDVQLTGRGGVPSTGVSGVWLELTVASPQQSGYVVAWPAGRPRPATSTVSFATGRTIANQIFVAVGASGAVSLENHSGGAIRLLGDVAGYTRSGTVTREGTLDAITSSRILDTGHGLGAPAAPVGAKKAITVRVAGRGGVPLMNTRAVVLNLTVASAQAPGLLSVYPGTYCVEAKVSSLNFTPGRTIANMIVVPLAPDGTVTIYNGSAGSARIIADVSGVVRGPQPPAVAVAAFNGMIDGAVSISDDGRYVGSGSYLWDTATGATTLMRGTRRSTEPPYCLYWEAPLDDGNGVLTGDAGSVLYFLPPTYVSGWRMNVWNKTAGTTKLITEQPVDSFAISDDGAYVAYTPENGVVDFWTPATRVLRWNRSTGTNQVIVSVPDDRAVTALMSGDGSTIVYEVDAHPDSPGPVDTYRWRNGQTEHLPAGHVRAISDNGNTLLATSPNAGGGEDLVQRIGSSTSTLASTAGPIDRVALSGDGRVAVWQQQLGSDPDGPRAVYRKAVTGPTTGITHYQASPGATSLALSDDGSRLVYADSDGVSVR